MARSDGVSRRAAAARRDERRRRATCTTRSTRTRGATGHPYLHPDEPTVQLDLLGSAQVIEWQEGKAAFLFASEGCWSELPHLYARYGTTATARADRAAQDARARVGAVLVCDSGMQATALAFDVLMDARRATRC